jgi:MinD-like ATPase involved in chromosome partitioning or flagellar assembly
MCNTFWSSSWQMNCKRVGERLLMADHLEEAPEKLAGDYEVADVEPGKAENSNGAEDLPGLSLDLRAHLETKRSAENLAGTDLDTRPTFMQRRPPVPAYNRYGARIGVAGLDEQELIRHTNKRFDESRRIGFLSHVRGSGKTTTTLMVGHVFAKHRYDRVIGFDCYPDVVSLSHRLEQRAEFDIIDLLTSPSELTRYADITYYTSQARSRFEVLAGSEHPQIAAALTEDDYSRVAEVLDPHYAIFCIDTGSAVLGNRSAMLELVDQAVLIIPPTLAGVQGAWELRRWLVENGNPDLAEDAVCVINGTSGRKGAAELDPPERNLVDRNGMLKLDKVEDRFLSGYREVVWVPQDPNLEAKPQPSLDDLRKPTQRAYLRLAAAIAAGF